VYFSLFILEDRIALKVTKWVVNWDINNRVDDIHVSGFVRKEWNLEIFIPIYWSVLWLQHFQIKERTFIMLRSGFLDVS